MELLLPSFGLFFLIFIFPVFLLWLFALIDVLRSDFKGPNDRLLWGLLIFFVPFLGTVLYFVFGRKNKVKLNQY